MACGTTQESLAHRNVEAYMRGQTGSYEPLEFGEFFEQTYPDEIEAALGTTDQVKYSLQHSYSANGEMHDHVYFHLNKDLQVIGTMTEKEMLDQTMKLIAP